MNQVFIFLEQNITFVAIVLLMCVLIELFLLCLKRGTDRRQHVLEDKTRATAFYRQLAENSPNVYMMIQKKGLRPIYISDNVKRELDCDAREISADVVILERITEKEDARQFWKQFHVWEQQESQEHLFYEFRFRKNKGMEQRWGELDLSLTKDGEYYLLVIRNVTRLHAEKEELQKEINEAVRVEQSKTAFLSQMSHEIRTPMNGIIGMISLAKMNYAQPKVVEDYLGQAENLSKFLLSIINDILDMSRIESGKVELEEAEFDLYDMSAKLNTMFAGNMEAKGITFTMNMEGFTIRKVVGDELRLTQVITNFLSNASKFTPAGGRVELTYKQMQIVNDKISLMIRVRDTGKGMSKEFLTRIFTPFEQESTGIARNYGGSGLGMSIADNLIRLMDGQIVIDSEEGKGSDFTVYVELPIAQGEQEAEAPYDQQLPAAENKHDKVEEISLKGMRFLMAEDNEINALVAQRLFASQQVDIEVAKNGQEAVTMFCNSEPGYYDAILMDIQMPVMDGWEATREIRASRHVAAHDILILAISADAFVEDKRHSKDVGMDGHISKPIDFQELKQILAVKLQEQKM